MKLVVPLLLLTQSLLAQGTLTFRADLLPLPSAPVGTPGGNVQFGFAGPVGGGIDTIHGYAEINASNLRILFAHVETAGGALIADATTIAMSCASGVPPSQCDWYAEWFLPYSNAQRDQLLAGEWHVILGLESSPDAIISGQLQPVPEPSALAIVGSFLFLLALPRKRSA
jgi:hypothetical protein